MRRTFGGRKGRPFELGFGPRGRKGDREDREESTGGSEETVVADEFDFGDSGRAVGQGVAEAAHAFGRPADEDPPGPARGADGADSDGHDEDHGAHDEDIDAEEGHDHGDGGYHDHVIDDVHVSASLTAIDGIYGMLGQAGPTSVRSVSYLPVEGIMEFDAADAVRLDNEGIWEGVILHEMLHVLGMGTLWGDFYMDLATGEGTSDTRFTGANGNAAYVAGVEDGTVPSNDSGYLKGIPPSEVPAPKAGLEEIDWGQGVVEPLMATFARITAPGNVLGLPAIAMPCGFSSEGLPLGLQAIGRPFEEATVIRLCDAYERMTDWTARRQAM